SLRVRVEVDSKGPSDTAIGSYGRDVDLPGQSRKEVTLYAYATGFSRSLDVRVVQGSTIIKTTQVHLDPIEQPQMVVGVVSSDASLLNVLRGEKAGHVPTPFMNRFGGGQPGQPGQAGQPMDAPGVTVAHMGLGDIPTLSTALNNLGAIVLEDATGTLSEEQTRSLVAWVARGGTLIVAPRPGGSQVPAPLLDLLPVK